MTTHAYASDSPAQRLDLHRPPTPGPHPLVIWLHGGGWRVGSRSLATSACQLQVLSAGFALASVGYRLSGEACFPAQLEDVRTATRWLRTNAPDLGLSGRMAAWGESAGGHLAALLGVHGDVEAVIDWYGPTDFLVMDAQTEAQGCPPFAGRGHDAPDSPESLLMGFPIHHDPDRVQRANPISHITSEAPPFLIQHGTEDCVVPTAQSERLHEALARAGTDSTLELLPGGHGGAAFTNPDNLDRVLRFLARALCLLLVLLAAAAPASAQLVHGHVREAERDVVIPGARLFLLRDDTAVDSTTADARGRYLLRAPAAGEYRIHFSMDGWASYASETIRLHPDATTTFDFRVPLISSQVLAQMSDILALEERLQNALPELCGEPFRPWEAGLLVGVVRDRMRRPLPHARVSAPGVAGAPPRTTIANQHGVYVLCNVPAGTDVRVTAETAAGAREVTMLEVRAGTVGWYDLLVKTGGE